MRYPAHLAFVEPARQRPQLWRLVLGLLCVVLVVSLYPLPLLLLIYAVGGPDAVTSFFVAVGRADSPGAVLFLLCSFVGMVLGTALAARLLHRRGLRSLFGPVPRLWRHFLIAAAIALAVFGLSALIPSDAKVTPNLPPAEWGLFVVAGLGALLLQTGAEEMLFRGYLQQQLAARFASPLVWMLVPATLFALGHVGSAGLGLNAWLLVAVTGLFGLYAADLTAATGSLGASWGFHFANNVTGVLIVGVEGQISGLSLYTVAIDTGDPAEMRGIIVTAAISVTVIWAAIRLALTRPRRARNTPLTG